VALTRRLDGLYQARPQASCYVNAFVMAETPAAHSETGAIAWIWTWPVSFLRGRADHRLAPTTIGLAFLNTGRAARLGLGTSRAT
jgi:hypothetical protein